jgi:copper resistance protein B
MDHSTMDHGEAAADQPITPIPVLTDEDRLAAFPEVVGHAAHDRSRHSFWMIDRLEASDGDNGGGLDWKATAWIGGDINRLWLRSEGLAFDGQVEHGDIEVLGGRAISPWWDVVAGIRHDFGEGLRKLSPRSVSRAWRPTRSSSKPPPIWERQGRRQRASRPATTRC